MLAVVFAGSSIGTDAQAHPHVFIDHSVTVLFDSRDIAGLRLSWTFDEMYSSMLRSDNVKSKGDRLSPDDVKSLKENAFSNLASFNYFLALSINDQPIKIEKVTDFDASLRGKKLNYTFTVPINTAAPREVNKMEVVVFDPEYYVEFTLSHAHPLTLEHGDALGAKCSIRRDVDRASALGPVQSDVIDCTYQQKP